MDVDDSLFRDWRYARSLVHQVLEGRTLKDLSILLEPGGLYGKDHGCAVLGYKFIGDSVIEILHTYSKKIRIKIAVENSMPNSMRLDVCPSAL